MKHSSCISTEGRNVLIVAPILLLILCSLILYIDLDNIWKIVCLIFLLIYSVFLIAPAIKNTYTSGLFRCELDENQFIQSVPIASYGDSFQLNLSDITMIELNHGEPSKWYIHTKETRHEISSFYSNPHNKFGQALLERLPQVTTINT